MPGDWSHDVVHHHVLAIAPFDRAGHAQTVGGVEEGDGVGVGDGGAVMHLVDDYQAEGVAVPSHELRPALEQRVDRLEGGEGQRGEVL